MKQIKWEKVTFFSVVTKSYNVPFSAGERDFCPRACCCISTLRLIEGCFIQCDYEQSSLHQSGSGESPVWERPALSPALCGVHVGSHKSVCDQANIGFKVGGHGKVMIEYAVATVGKWQASWESGGLVHRPPTINKPGWNIWICLTYQHGFSTTVL